MNEKILELQKEEELLKQERRKLQTLLIINRRTSEEIPISKKLDEINQNLELISQELKLETKLSREIILESINNSQESKKPGLYFKTYNPWTTQKAENKSVQKKSEDKEFEAFLEWKKARKEEKLKEEFRQWKLTKEKAKSVFEEPVKPSTNTLESKIADYLENSSLDENLEEELIQEAKIMTIEQSDEEDSENESLKSFTLETKMMKEEHQIIPHNPGKEQASTSEEAPTEKMEIDKKIEKPRQSIKYQFSGQNKINRFEPRDSPDEGISINGIYLDIDCEIDPAKKISQWIKENRAVALAQGMDVDTAFNFFKNSTKGIVANFLSGLGEENLMTFFRSAT